MKALIVGGGRWQLPILEFFKNKNYHCGIINPFPTRTTEKAHEYFCADVTDAKFCLEIAKKFSPEVIVSDMTDVAVYTWSVLCERLNLPGNSPKSVIKFVDKFETYKHALDVEVPVPFTSEEFFCPCVAKPKRGNASVGIEFVNEHKEVNMSGKIAQEIKCGREIIIDGFCHDGKHTSLCVADKKYFSPGIISEVRYPSSLNDEVLRAVKKANDRFVETSGLNFGITHSEWIVSEDEFWLIEIAARGGGFRIGSDIIKHVSGFPIYENLYRCVLGKPLLDYEEKRGEAMIKFFEFASGKIKKISGLSECKNRVFDCDVLHEEVLPRMIDGKTRHAYAVILGDCENSLKFVEENFKIETHL